MLAKFKYPALAALLFLTILFAACTAELTTVTSVPEATEPPNSEEPTEEPTAEPPAEVPTAYPVDEAGNLYVNSVDVLLMESFPLQAQAVVTGDLANGCIVLNGLTAVRDGDSWRIEFDLTHQGEMCTEALVPFEENVALDILGVPAGTYTVSANDAAATFTFSVDNVAADEGAAPNDVVAPIVSIDMSGWLVFVNYDYGFSFLYPPDWQVRQEQGPNHTLAGHLLYVEPTYNEQYRFMLAFKHANHEMHLTRTGMREGEFFAYGTIDFLG
ncbi:MAG: hypothetical protein KDE09_24040, partial [Anaerolineales bacterium]|nr:hypothetical protein [Anaerolineales bacterium]